MSRKSLVAVFAVFGLSVSVFAGPHHNPGPRRPPHNDGVRLAADIVSIVGNVLTLNAIYNNPNTVFVHPAPTIVPSPVVVQSPVVIQPPVVVRPPVVAHPPVVVRPAVVAPRVIAPHPRVLAPHKRPLPHNPPQPRR